MNSLPARFTRAASATTELGESWKRKYLLRPHGAVALIGGRLHGELRHDLEQMVLDDIAQAAGAFVKCAAAAHPEILAQRDLDAGDIVAIPDRFEKRIGETEIEDVHDRLFPEKMIDAENVVFAEHRQRDAIELARRDKVASERFFDDDAPALAAAPGGAEPFALRREQPGRYGEIICGALRPAQRAFESFEGDGVGVIAAHVAQRRQQALERVVIIDAAARLDAVARALAHLRHAPRRASDPDLWHGEHVVLGHGV